MYCDCAFPTRDWSNYVFVNREKDARFQHFYRRITERPEIIPAALKHYRDFENRIECTLNRFQREKKMDYEDRISFSHAIFNNILPNFCVLEEVAKMIAGGDCKYDSGDAASRLKTIDISLSKMNALLKDIGNGKKFR
ncbi:MAG: hypothetical protein NTU57_02065 [Candidatus Aenigmarchaeota archaeon]|nr:hypothetical protein [Candidatus Aenigmarchaeota archaeon]